MSKGRLNLYNERWENPELQLCLSESQCLFEGQNDRFKNTLRHSVQFHYSKLILNFVLLIFLRTLIIELFFSEVTKFYYTYLLLYSLMPMTFYRIDMVIHLAGWEYSMNLLTIKLASLLFYRKVRPSGNKEWWFPLFFTVDRCWRHSRKCNSLRNWVKFITAGTLLISWSTAEQTLQAECKLHVYVLIQLFPFLQH